MLKSLSLLSCAYLNEPTKHSFEMLNYTLIHLDFDETFIFHIFVTFVYNVK